MKGIIQSILCYLGFHNKEQRVFVTTCDCEYETQVCKHCGEGDPQGMRPTLTCPVCGYTVDWAD